MPNNIGEIFLFALLLLGSSPLWAASFETLLMPGKVIEGHAKYEEQCERCHANFSKDEQRTLCLDCHEKVAADINKDEGYHGLDSAVGETACRSCHTDHKGRDKKIVHLDPHGFDHDLTDYKLEKRHQQVACIACHPKDRKHRDTPQLCIDCHKSDDPHRGNLGKKCNDCHSTTGWQKNRFDHDKSDFKLKGAHKKASCNSCHIDQRYKKTPKQCIACHQINDIHLGGFGEKCESCHNNEKWEKGEFNHDKKTEFPLRGVHTKLACNSCHNSKLNRADNKGNPGKTCIACHQQRDRHRGSFGEKCDKCHNNESWSKTRFDHQRDTKFSLDGKHGDLSCSSCHQAGLFEKKPEKSCTSCHKVDDPHGGKLGKECQQCHNSDNWRKKIAFDHDLTRFPLIGLHTTTPCGECHLDRSYQQTERDCYACHQQDDSHEGLLGKQCASCHNPNDWKLWLFDHDTQTKYRLEGSHRGLKCEACHIDPVTEQRAEPRRCISCHRDEDAHWGTFGKQCEQCHLPTQFEEIVLPRQ
ncbi:hypothetical protein BOW53_08265 [Solemya pervernicosa gill symbiont]|uniref:Cytochrome c7-like domain-containing protein n=2 Tax=Gammaproteobacteria incertae sedis TaxID=118884 RepID=A0A1T2L5D6_9GAMM|nr:hypothetical protein BOW53_08265 [Solemya pervernicosa gill symbiont]